MSSRLSFLIEQPLAYKILSWATALLYFYLFVSLLFFPDSFIRDMGLTGSETTFILARRVSMLMLGFSALAMLGASAPHSVARQALVLAISINMTGFATMSVYEYVRGTVNNSILQAATIETFLAVAYFLFWLAGRCRSQESHNEVG
ncbi:MAG: hypothetical protein JW730_20160 [Anaerolineales bacterium]|nr:hypothetical protein [Anaerolineales bacterium]